MKTHIRKSLLAATFLAVTLVSFNGMSQTQGNIAPDFTLNSLSGGSFKLSESKGKVVLIFLLGNTCSFCISASPTIQSELINTFSSNPNFLAIGIDTWDGSSTLVNSFKQKTGLSVNYLLMGSQVAATYQTTWDRLMVIDQSGILKHKGTTGAINDISATKTLLQTLLKDQTTAITPEIDRTENQLIQNFPNPVNEATTISFVLKTKAPVNISLFNISGKKIKEMVNDDLTEGVHSLELKKGTIPSGVYFYKMVSGNFTQTRKIIFQ